MCDDTTWKTVTVEGTSRLTRCDCWHQHLYESLLKSYFKALSSEEK